VGLTFEKIYSVIWQYLKTCISTEHSCKKNFELNIFFVDIQIQIQIQIQKNFIQKGQGYI
jgi:hypothetical protein